MNGWPLVVREAVANHWLVWQSTDPIPNLSAVNQFMNMASNSEFSVGVDYGTQYAIIKMASYWLTIHKPIE